MAVWAAWLPATRIAIADGLGPLDIALLRLAVPAALLAPVWWRTGLLPEGLPRPALLAMLGWGAPFVLLLTTGLRNASVAHTAALVPCTMPVVAALGARIVLGERIGRGRRAGIALIAMAAFLILAGVVAGDGRLDAATAAVLLCASAGWAAYTVAFRRSGLAPAQAAALVFAWSTLLLLPAALVADSGLWRLPAPSLAFHVVAQGLLSGFAATVAYGMAIERLGVARAASFSVLVPVLATGLAWLWLSETPSALDAVALALGTLGVAMVNGAIRIRPTVGRPPSA